jgi:hypothetical protein
MQRGHRSGAIFAEKPVSHDEVIALTKFQKKRGEIREVVTVVRVTEDDIAALCRGNAADERASIARSGDRNDSSAQLVGDVQRSVGTAVVRDDDLAGDLELPDGVVSLLNADPQRLGLIEARHDDREFQCCFNVMGHRCVTALLPDLAHLNKGTGIHESVRVGFLELGDGGIPRQLDRDALFA